MPERVCAGSGFGGVATQTWIFELLAARDPVFFLYPQSLAYILLCSLRQHHVFPYLFRLWPGLHNRVDHAMIYTTLNRYENDCLPGSDVSLWRSYRITMQITPANMYANHSPIEYASLKIIRAWMSLLSKYFPQSHAFYIHWQRRSYLLNTYGRRRPVLSQKDVWSPYPIIELDPARSCPLDYAWYENEPVAG